MSVIAGAALCSFTAHNVTFSAYYATFKKGIRKKGPMKIMTIA